MTDLVRYYIKTSIAFLGIGLLLGGYLLGIREMEGTWPPPLLVTAHVHLILIGFVMMMIMGVALWMFPKPARDDTWYRLDLARLIYWIMVVATAVRFAGEVLSVRGASPILHGGILAAGGLQVAGIIVFFGNLWTRIRAPGSRVRPGKSPATDSIVRPK